jgi:hypothetical protein
VRSRRSKGRLRSHRSLLKWCDRDSAAAGVDLLPERVQRSGQPDLYCRLSGKPDLQRGGDGTASTAVARVHWGIEEHEPGSASPGQRANRVQDRLEVRRPIRLCDVDASSVIEQADERISVQRAGGRGSVADLEPGRFDAGAPS